MTFGTRRWWGRQPHAPAAFTPRKCSWYSFSLRSDSTPGPWFGNISLKNPVTPPGIDPGNVRLVAQRLNHYTTPGLIRYSSCEKKERHFLIRSLSPDDEAMSVRMQDTVLMNRVGLTIPRYLHTGPRRPPTVFLNVATVHHHVRRITHVRTVTLCWTRSLEQWFNPGCSCMQNSQNGLSIAL